MNTDFIWFLDVTWEKLSTVLWRGGPKFRVWYSSRWGECPASVCNDHIIQSSEKDPSRATQPSNTLWHLPPPSTEQGSVEHCSIRSKRTTLQGHTRLLSARPRQKPRWHCCRRSKHIAAALLRESSSSIIPTYGGGWDSNSMSHQPQAPLHM